jgi:uncharacterized protein (TIGR03437 family)
MPIHKWLARSVSALIVLAPSLSAQLAHSLPSKAVAANDQGPVDPAFRLPFITLVLKPSPAQQAHLDRLIERQGDQASANYHKWLTPEQFGERFGLAQADYAQVGAWLELHGLHVEQTARARNWITFSGTAHDVEIAFETRIHRFVLNGEEHFSNSTEISLPPLLENAVAEIRGLNDFWRLPSAVDAQNTNGTGVTQIAPDDWATIYNVAPLYAMGIDGAGQRVGILGRSDMSQSYVDAFRSQFGLPPSQVEQHLVGPDPGITNAAGEAALDLEWSGAIARGATIVYIYAGNFNDAAQAAVDQNLATVISESFGTCEFQAGVGLRQIAQQAAAQGITFVASSGDSGPAGCDAHGFFGTPGGPAPPVSDGPAVSIPASFPEVTAIGGTQFSEAGGQYWRNSNTSTGASAISYIPEMVWNESGAGGLLASGGGASIFFPKPAWQTGPGVPMDNARDVPDISFSASGNHDPYMVINANGQRASGGTSAGAPSFAGVIGLLNQYLVSRGIHQQPGLGMINPELYRLARTTPIVFHDITQGSNIVPCTAGSPGCVNGSLGVTASLGYDLATGLGSIDVLNLVTYWAGPVSDTITSLTASPTSIAFGDSVQLTATIAPANNASSIPSGTVTFIQGETLLGSSAIRSVNGQALATLTVTGTRLRSGTATITSSYSGDSNFNPSRGSTNITVSAAPAGSFVSIDITPNPAHAGQFIKVSLTELAGVGTTLTGWTINGVDDFSLFLQDFRTTTLSPYGTLSATITSANVALLPSARVYVFSGVDGDGRMWSQQYTLTLEGSLQTPPLTLASVPQTVEQNPGGDSSCQWSQLLLIQEQRGFAVQLTKLLAGPADWTSRIQQLFGTTHLAPLGVLQAQVCRPGPNAPPPTSFEIDGFDQAGGPVTATVQTTYTGPASTPSNLSIPHTPIVLTTASPTSLVTLTSPTTFAASVVPANRSTAWLKISQTANQISLTASPAGLTQGVYNATLVLQASNAVPQFQEVPVVFLIGNTSGISISGVANGASFQQAFAPGAILSAFGTQLGPNSQSALSLPLPLSLLGVSATVNGVPAPLYYVSPTQLNIQIPYETGSGPAILGVNNNGSVVLFPFSVAPSASGIFADANHALVPVSTAKRGDTLLAFITGEGEVSPPLSTGATPYSATPIVLLPQPAMPLSVTVGGVAAPIAFVGIPSGLAGVTQVNFIVPNGVPPGPQALVITVGGTPSAAATILVE